MGGGEGIPRGRHKESCFYVFVRVVLCEYSCQL